MSKCAEILQEVMKYADETLSLKERHDANFYFSGAILSHLEHSLNDKVEGDKLCKSLKAAVDYQINKRK
ncbi:hypothetical protein [Bacillus sp. FJAT-45037]|uniref:hypothetical protein n=1 Tax=Bacillus sp. FJAT-45037 TaxID=2011007 RepID=UPI000C25152D|nr:hypothetical protein [Bacillus sp. FJAT-45037]